jgi:hypothetical protein
MGRFDGQRIGLRDNLTGKLIIAYPYNVSGPDELVCRRVKNWYYQTNCSVEEQLKTAYVDFLTDDEISEYALR